ncbi:cytochrome P450 [Thelonectria olida]|uniref:Cytochrome P450 n=1 Tax=Thelonectria olida TaxID=1576542 RepID=A0A9P8WGP8_9HYPO|nr:cytochrome P450 [Thelonectria olida]
MAFPWENITGGAFVSAVLLAWAKDELTRWSTLNSFLLAWVAWLMAWGVWAVWVYPLFLSPLRHLPEPSGNHWLFGQGKRIIAQPSGMPMREWINEIPNDGVIRYRGLFNQERLLIASPKALAEVLVTNNYAFEKPVQVRWSLGRILGVGVLLAEGEEHKMQRRNLTPAFAFRQVKNLYPVFWKKACEATRTMTAAFNTEGETEVEIMSWASRATLDIIGVAGMGRDFGAIHNENSPLAKTYRTVFKPSKQGQILALLGFIVPLWLVNMIPVQRNDDIHQAASEIRAVCRDLIREKKDNMTSKEEAGVDILSVALESGGFTDENLVNQLMTFLAAGHETTASALTWAIYMLCRYPKVQSRLREEVRQRLPSLDSDVDITSMDIDRMPYLNAVCSEVLRYYSPVPITLREAAHDTTILDHPVRKGTRVMLVPWATNFDRELWGPDSEMFNPERWLPPLSSTSDGDKSRAAAAASGGASSNYAFLTFLHGPRSCIGQSFAKAEFACVLAAWVGRFEFALADPALEDETKLVIRGGVTARPAQGMHVRVKLVGGY